MQRQEAEWRRWAIGKSTLELSIWWWKLHYGGGEEAKAEAEAEVMKWAEERMSCCLHGGGKEGGKSKGSKVDCEIK